jgi:pimeloyl-ACP methyl ester carboxylesterase
MSAILIGQDVIHYEVLGRGRPVIFLHGWVGSWRYWIPCMQSTSAQFRAYALDLWGFGDTAKKPEYYTIEMQVALLDVFLNQMGIGKVALVGHGLGAVVAFLYAWRHPDFVDRVMAIEYPLDEGMINPRLRTAPPVELADWLLGKNELTESARGDAPKTDPASVQSSLSSLASVGLNDLWRKIPTALLLVNGQNDPVIEAPSMEQLSDLPQNTHAFLFEQVGHFPMLEDTSKFNRLLADFLALPSGDSPRQLQIKEEWQRRVR